MIGFRRCLTHCLLLFRFSQSLEIPDNQPWKKLFQRSGLIVWTLWLRPDRKSIQWFKVWYNWYWPEPELREGSGLFLMHHSISWHVPDLLWCAWLTGTVFNRIKNFTSDDENVSSLVKCETFKISILSKCPSWHQKYRTEASLEVTPKSWSFKPEGVSERCWNDFFAITSSFSSCQSPQKAVEII